MVNRLEFSAPRVLHRNEASPNKAISFKQLLDDLRSVLQGGKRPQAAGPRPELAEKPEEIRADSAGQRLGSALPGSVEPRAGEIDPLELSLAPPLPPLAFGVAPFSGGAGSALEGKPAAASPAFESALVESVVRRVVWGGDRRRGIARLELDGDYAGTTIWVRGEGGALEVEIALGSGSQSSALPDRLLARLRARGLDVERVAVR
jgi:hypothetical protein